MKKFISKILIFFLIIIIVDFIFGKVCQYLNSHAKGGDTASHWNITNVQTSPILILGSSRAMHHYKPEIFEDSLGLDVYNCGVDGNGILFNYGRLKLLLERYVPILVIYDATPWLDITGEDNMKYLQYLKRWYDHDVIDSLVRDISFFEPIKSYSNLYRYNSTFIQMLSDNIKPMQEIGYNGYKPLYGSLEYTPKENSSDSIEWDELKEKYFNKLIDLCKEKNLKLIVTYSPWFNKKDASELEKISKLCENTGIPVINNYDNPELNNNPLLFVDPSHLNDKGATLFSKTVVSEIKQIIDE